MKPLLLQVLLLPAVLLLVAACAKNPGNAVQAPPAAQSTSGPHRGVPSRIPVDFLKWYRDHLPELNGITLVNQSGPGGDTTRAYSVNAAGTEAYLAALRGSGYVSPRYLDAWREYFRKGDASFKSEPQYEGPPRGFDYDFVFQSQDYETELTQLEGLTVTPLQATPGGAAFLVAFPTGHRLKFWLTEAGNGWLIDRIGPGQE